MIDNNHPHDIFISYSRKNKDTVLPIKDELERLGLACWIDLSDIPCGAESFKKKVISGIKQTHIAFLFFLSAESQDSEYALKEINFAKKIAKKRVILVRFNDDKMTDDFAFDYQDADIIDWRIPEQKGKLLRDLKNWASQPQPLNVVSDEHQGAETSCGPECVVEPCMVREEEAERKAWKGVNCKTIILPGGAKMEMIYCPPGEFMMGSPATEEGRGDDETQHRVRLTKGFWLGKYPVTQGQWQSVMGRNPSKFTGDDVLPVEWVSWNDCKRFIKKVKSSVKQQLGGDARFPTEAEWEYACRAGTTTAYFWGNALNGDRANCDGRKPCGTKTKGPYLKKTTPVGRYAPNPWGFHDMHGNVFEWCNDWAGCYPTGSVTDPIGPARGDRRVLRGGGWGSYARYCRSASCGGYFPGCCNGDFGFRLCCSAGPHR